MAAAAGAPGGDDRRFHLTTPHMIEDDDGNDEDGHSIIYDGEFHESGVLGAKQCTRCNVYKSVKKFRKKRCKGLAQQCSKCRDTAASVMAQGVKRLGSIRNAAAAVKRTVSQAGLSPAQRRLAPRLPLTGRQRPRAAVAREPVLTDLRVAEPPFLQDLADPALSEADMQRIANFNTAIYEDDPMEHCERCNETWFEMKLKRGVCHKCILADSKEKRAEDEPFMWSAENNMHFGDLPDIPKPTQIEEMLLSPVHCFVSVMQVRGGQYKYKGHVCHFMRDTGKVFQQIPRLPEELDVIFLRPENHDNDPRLQRQFAKQMTARRSVVRRWAEYLLAHNAYFRTLGITLSEQNLAQLPEDGNVVNNLAVEQVDPADLLEIAEEDYDPDAIEDVAVPNHIVAQRDLDALREQLAGNDSRGRNVPIRRHIDFPNVQSTPISEMSRSIPLLALAFWSVFPNGVGDFNDARLRQPDFGAYLQHLLKWEDGRFAQHERLRYAAFNMWMRQQVNSSSIFYAQRVPGRDNMDINELKDFFQGQSPEVDAFLNSIVRFAGKLPGTRAYWLARRNELTAYVHALGTPAAFMTFSAADNHWRSLAQHMPRFEEWLAADETTRKKIAWQNLRHNPHIAAWHFMSRRKAFFTHVVGPKFNINEFWHRFEFQGRGSSHDHGLYWMKSGHVPGNMADELERDRFARFWGLHITAHNPEPDRVMQPEEGNVLTTVILDQEYPDFGLLSRVINRVQRHHCNSTYCLVRKIGPRRRPEEQMAAQVGEAAAAELLASAEHHQEEVMQQPPVGDGDDRAKVVCRFYFPRSSHLVAHLTKDFNPKWWMFDPERNDARLNSYNRAITIGWLANTDISPCTDAQAVLEYIAKYCSKAEKKTQSFKNLAKEILPKVSSRKPLVSFTSKLMNKLVAERDWGSQEICHIMLRLHLQVGSRQVETVDCRHPDDQYRNLRIDVDENAVRSGRNPYEKYLARDASLATLTYFEMRVRWNLNRSPWQPYTRAEDRVLNYYPRYKPDKQMEDFCRVKLMLHHPHVRLDELLHLDGQHSTTWQEAYQHCLHNHPDLHDNDYYGEILPDPDANPDFEELEQDDEEIPAATWQELARELPNIPLDTEDIELIGNRDIDLAKDWSSHVGNYSGLSSDYWKDLKAEAQMGQDIDDMPDSAADGLSNEQRVIYNLFMEYARDYLNDSSPNPILLNVDGGGGTGKSFVIKLISSHIQKLGLPEGFVVRSAPTGVAANGIAGSTLHSLFKLPVTKNEMPPLSATDCTAIRNRLNHLRLLIIDEKSMVGLRMMNKIDQRLRQLWPEFQDKFFGGRSVMLSGDFFQLPAVAEKPLYVDDSKKPLTDPADISGRQAYLQFDRTVELSVVQRQQGEAQAAFRQTLENIRRNGPTVDDWKLLCTRLQSKLSLEEVDSFKDALRIYSTNLHVREYNYDHLVDLEEPAVQCIAEHTAPTATLQKTLKNVSSQDAGNLHNMIPLMIGSRVMLTENVWTAAGLVNGAMGTVYDFAWRPDADPRKDQPFVVLVDFDKYSGSAFEWENPNVDRPRGRNVVPIFPSTRDFLKGTAACTRKQVPLTIAYAISVHKSQGITCEQVVVDLSTRDFQPGLTYVALSRVTALEGLMVDKPFGLSDLRSKTREGVQAREKDMIRRRHQHVTLDMDDEEREDLEMQFLSSAARFHQNQ